MEGKLKHLKTCEKKAANNLFWSPQGGFIVIAGLHNLNGVLEFYNAIDFETMATEEHFMTTAVEWDPTGRYVSSVVSYWRHQLENGYNLYSFQGKLLKHVLKDKFYQLLWRPRPASLLSDDRVKHIKNNVHEYAKQLKNEDKKKKEEEKNKKRAKREGMRKAFEELMQQRAREYQEEHQLRTDLRIPDDVEDDSDYVYTEQWVEELEDVQEIIINED